MKPQRVLITGCSSGVGRATALRLAGAGHGVFAGVRRAEDAGALQAEGGGRVEVLTLDVTDAASVTAATDAATEAGPIDVLVNNAGIPCLGSMEEIDLADLGRAMEVNFYGALRCCQAVLPAMRRRGRGLIINISSSIGVAALPLYGGYCATKFALEAASEALRHEVAPFGVAVRVLEPGLIATPFGDKKRAEAPDRIPAGSPYAGRLDNPSPPDLALLISTPARVAEVLQEMIEQPGGDFRRACGEDARRWITARCRLDDAAFFSALAEGGYAF